MASSLGLAAPALSVGLLSTSGLQRIQRPFLEFLGETNALELSTWNVWYGRSQASSRVEGLPPRKPQDFQLQDFSSPPGKWRTGKRRTPNFRHLDLERHISKGPSRSPDGQRLAKLCEEGRICDALDALNQLVERGCHVHNNLFYRLLKRCTASKDMFLGRRIHVLIVKCGYERDAFLITHLIGLYASHAMLGEAMTVFSKVSKPSPQNWATIIFACARHGEAAQAIRLYRQLLKSDVQPDNCVYVAVLKACASASDLVAGKEVHAHILSSPVKPDMFVQNGLVDMYVKCRSMVDACKVFDSLPERSAVTWTTMVSGYAQQGMGQEALSLYSNMVQQGLSFPDSATFVCLLQACAGVGAGALQRGIQLHEQIQELGLQNDVLVGGSLVNMYAKCGRIEVARGVFDSLPERDLVTWNTMLTGYAQQGMGHEALRLFSIMQKESISSPDSATLVSVLRACASVGFGALRQGKGFHAQIKGKGLQFDQVVGGSLVNMYAKCGSIEDARAVFNSLSNKNIVAWNAIIAGYVKHGMGEEALSLYDSMQQEGVLADSITFASLFQACACVAGLNLGKLFHAQVEERGMQDVVVGAALVNMYAKCGSMTDAQQVFDTLPEQTIEAWNALIGGYSRQGDSKIVFELFDKMRLGGIVPNGITFLSLLAVCSHVGLVAKGLQFLEVMRTDCGISPSVEHYACVMDLLGRAGHLDEALQMAKTLPFPHSGSVWHTLLGACSKWNDVEIGEQAFEFANRLDEKNPAPFVVMSNIYARAGMWGQAKEMQVRRKLCEAWKAPGHCWWTDSDGVVHKFGVGGKLEVSTAGQ